VRTAVSGGSELLIFVPRAAHSHDSGSSGASRCVTSDPLSTAADIRAIPDHVPQATGDGGSEDPGRMAQENV
jgi:hypothetical protein